MNAARLSLEGIPRDIATAISRFGFAMNDCGGITVGDEAAFRKTGAVAALRRTELIEAIKSAITAKPAPSLPYAGSVRIGFGGDDFPEPGFELRLPPFDSMEEAQLAAREGVQA